MTRAPSAGGGVSAAAKRATSREGVLLMARGVGGVTAGNSWREDGPVWRPPQPWKRSQAARVLLVQSQLAATGVRLVAGVVLVG